VSIAVREAGPVNEPPTGVYWTVPVNGVPFARKVTGGLGARPELEV